MTRLAGAAGAPADMVRGSPGRAAVEAADPGGGGAREPDVAHGSGLAAGAPRPCPRAAPPNPGRPLTRHRRRWPGRVAKTRPCRRRRWRPPHSGRRRDIAGWRTRAGDDGRQRAIPDVGDRPGESVGGGPAFVKSAFDVRLPFGEAAHFVPEGGHRTLESIFGPVDAPVDARRDSQHEAGESEPDGNHRPDDGNEDGTEDGRVHAGEHSTVSAPRPRPDWLAIAGDVAVALFGEPSSRTRRELRFGRRGSLSVKLDAGTWFDFEGGGVVDLVKRERRCTAGEAVDWLRGQGFLPAAGIRGPESPHKKHPEHGPDRETRNGFRPGSVSRRLRWSAAGRRRAGCSDRSPRARGW